MSVCFFVYLRSKIELLKKPDGKSTSFQILIAEWIPSLNKGELAILYGMLETFQELGKTRISIFSFYPNIDRTRYPSNVKILDVVRLLHLISGPAERSIVINVWSSLTAMAQHLFFGILYIGLGKATFSVMRGDLWKEYYKSDVIIIGHNQSGFSGGLGLIFYPIYITLLAKLLSKPVAIYANGITPFDQRLRKTLAKWVLNKVDLVTVRDEISYRYFKALSTKNAHIFLTADPAILLPATNREVVEKIFAKENINVKDRPLIGLMFNRKIQLFAFPNVRNCEERYRKSVEFFARLVDYTITNLGATVLLLSHCIEPYHQRDDRMVARDVYVNATNKHKIRLITNEYSAQELKGLLGELDLLISERTHAVIAALSMGTPSIAISRRSDTRSQALVGKMMSQENAVYDIEELKFGTLVKHISSLLSTGSRKRTSLKRTAKLVKQKAMLNGKLLRNLLGSRHVALSDSIIRDAQTENS